MARETLGQGLLYALPVHISEFDYHLPPEAIAQEPAAERADSRLMLLERSSGRLSHHVFRDLPELLRTGDLLVVNRSRVFPARLLGRRAGGGRAEILLLEPLEPPGPRQQPWRALLRPGGRLRPGQEVVVEGGLRVRVESAAQEPSAARTVRLVVGQGTVQEAIERLGHVPLPPYIRRTASAIDRERYQTVYAAEPGSVAAPTAGLHFSRALLERLAGAGITSTDVLLHVGPATFQPVRVEEVEQHRLPGEPFSVPPATAARIASIRQAGGRVVAVGTTSVRTLESAADQDGQVQPARGTTDLVIVPGYRFRAVDALITNFHLPRSSLLLLVCAFAGRQRVLSAYAEALARGYRFYSYGDAMLIL